MFGKSKVKPQQQTPTTKLKVVNISNDLHADLKDYCTQRGYKLGGFVERVIADYIAAQSKGNRK